MIKKKTLQLHPSTQAHDRNTLIRRAEGFLTKGHKVCFICKFKGRENSFPEQGENQLTTIINALADVCVVEAGIRKTGPNMTLHLTPKLK